MENDKVYHARRAAMQRSMAERCDDPAAADAHRILADLHDARARGMDEGRPVLRVIMPA